MIEQEEIDALRKEAATVAKKLHQIMSRVEFTNGSLGGSLAGILLYATLVSREARIPHSVLHLMIDVLDYEIPNRDLVNSVLAANTRMDQIINEVQKAVDNQ